MNRDTDDAAGADNFDPSEYGASGIASDYDALYVREWDTNAAVACLADLAGEGRLLEFGIGSGRLALPLQTAGVDVSGIDASEEMVAELRAKPRGDEIPVTIGNFASTHVGSGYDIVVLAVNTIFALPDQDTQIACFVNAARHLAPGGAFVVEAWIPDVGAFRNRRLVRQRILEHDVMSIESARLEPADQRMRTTQAVLRNGSIRLYPADHRYAWPAELDLMARLAGMTRQHRWEDWNRVPFDDDSHAHVTVYRLIDEPRPTG